MPIAQRARLLEIHIAEGHQHSGKPLYEVLVGKCRELGVAGVTVFRGFEGYGETATIHRKHLLTNDQPVIVMVIDSGETIARVLPTLEELVDRAMITVSQVTMKRVKNMPAKGVQ